jgi:YggT family protein
VALFSGKLIEIAVIALTVLILGRVFLSWFDPGARSRLGGILYSTTEPFLGPVRRRLPPTGALDLSPFIVLVGLSILMRLF